MIASERRVDRQLPLFRSTAQNRRRSERPIAVLHLIDSLWPGGAERLLLTTLRNLDGRRFRSAVATLFPPFDLRRDLEDLYVPVHHLALRRSTDWRRGIINLARLLRRGRVTILHTHLRFSNVYGRLAALLARTPVVVTSFHHLDYTHWPAVSRSRKLWKRLDRMTAALTNDAFIAVSRAVEADYSRHLDLDAVTVLYNYLDLDEFVPIAPERARAKRGEFGWTAEDFVLTNVARLAPEKGQELLLVAMREVARAIPTARLLLVGDGPAEPSLRALSEAFGLKDRVHFAGNRRDVAELLAMSDVFLFPSLAEGLGIALMEAMAVGLPVIASQTDGITEVVQHGVDGLLVEPASPEAIARAVIRLYGEGDLRQRLGRQARQTAARRFDAREGVKRLESLYTRLVRSNGAPMGVTHD